MTTKTAKFNKDIMPRTEAVMKKHNLNFDYFGGIASIDGNDRSVKLNNTITLGLRDVVCSFDDYIDESNGDMCILFYYNTATAYNFKWRKYMNHKTKTEWFDVFDEIATILAEETGATHIMVRSGRKDASFLREKGYNRSPYDIYEYKRDISKTH